METFNWSMTIVQNQSKKKRVGSSMFFSIKGKIEISYQITIVALDSIIWYQMRSGCAIPQYRLRYYDNVEDSSWKLLRSLRKYIQSKAYQQWILINLNIWGTRQNSEFFLPWQKQLKQSFFRDSGTASKQPKTNDTLNNGLLYTSSLQ